jgi:uncharacterized protein (AIM24 family)
VRGNLFTDHAVTNVPDRFTLQNGKILKVMLGPDVLARQGSMIAFEGWAEFEYEHPSFVQAMQSWRSGEAFPLMRVKGNGMCFFANFGADVLPIQLQNEGIIVRARNVLALDESVQWGTQFIDSAMAGFSGISCLELGGQGWIALTTDGPPVVLRADEAPTYTDPDSVIAWSSSLRPVIKERAVVQSVSNRDAAMGRGSGEEVQMQFRGSGFVVVQPSERG